MFYKNILSVVGVNKSPLAIQREYFSISKSNFSPKAHIPVTQLHPKDTWTHSSIPSLLRESPIHTYTTKVKYMLLRTMLARKKASKTALNDGWNCVVRIKELRISSTNGCKKRVTRISNFLFKTNCPEIPSKTFEYLRKQVFFNICYSTTALARFPSICFFIIFVYL